MKILVCGYACNPYGGSEPGVGWTAVTRIAMHHDVCVITDIHNKAGWERGFQENAIPGTSGSGSFAIAARAARTAWSRTSRAG